MVLTEVVQSSWEPRTQNQLLSTCIISITTDHQQAAELEQSLGMDRICGLRRSWEKALRAAADGELLHGRHNCPHDAHTTPQSNKSKGKM